MTAIPALPSSKSQRAACRIFLSAVVICTLIVLFRFIRCTYADQCVAFEDFEVFYRPALALATDQLGDLYPVNDALAWLHGAKGAPAFFHFSLYPPSSLFMLMPMGFLSPWTALYVFLFAQFAVLGLGLSRPYFRELVPLPHEQPWASKVQFTTLFAPFVLVCTLAAQVGMFASGLFLLVLAWRRTRPVCAGIALALLALKPQIGFVLPILLLAERNWRTLIVAALGVLFLAGFTYEYWGAALWEEYFRMVPVIGQLLAAAPPKLLGVSASVYYGLRILQVPHLAAEAIQLIVTLTVVACVWPVFRRAGNEADKAVLAALGTYLITPYAYIYDTVTLALPGLVFLRRAEAGTATSGERIALILLAFMPVLAIKLQSMHMPYTSLILLFAFAVARLRAGKQTA